MAEQILFNFRTPVELKEAFEKSCSSRNVSMTSQLNILIHHFLVEDQQKSERLDMNSNDPIAFFSSNYELEHF